MVDLERRVRVTTSSIVRNLVVMALLRVMLTGQQLMTFGASGSFGQVGRFGVEFFYLRFFFLPKSSPKAIGVPFVDIGVGAGFFFVVVPFLLPSVDCFF